MGRSRDNAPSLSRPIDKDLETIILGDAIESAKLTNQKAESLGADLHRKGLKTAQIRNIFGKVRQIEMGWLGVDDEPSSRRELVLLIPKMRYQTERKGELKPLADVLIDCINLIEKGESKLSNRRERFQRFVDFFEAILAYHKAEGGN